MENRWRSVPTGCHYSGQYDGHGLRPGDRSGQFHLPHGIGIDSGGTVFVAETEELAEEQAESHYGHRVKLTRDEDVLDTWFSSALWPFSTLGWPDNTKELSFFYPTSVLITSFDILFFWVARMIMFGIEFTGEPPFNTVFLHGLIRAGNGKKNRRYA